MLRERGVRFQNAAGEPDARQRDVRRRHRRHVKHVDFMTEAWVDDPLKVVLLVPGFARAGGAPAGATAKPK